MKLDSPHRLKEFLRYQMVIKGRPRSTVDAYESDLRMMFKFMVYDKDDAPDYELNEAPLSRIDDAFLQSITEEDILSYLFWVTDERKNMNSTRNRKIASCRVLFSYLHNRAKVIPHNPSENLEKPKIGKRNPAYLSVDQCRELLESTKFRRNRYRDLCIITWFLHCGIRLSELCSVNISDIRDDELTVIGKGDKQREIPLNKVCIETYELYLEERAELLKRSNYAPDSTDALFISERLNRVNKRTVQHIVEDCIKRSKLGDLNYSTHKLRHTAASLMVQNGVDVRSIQELLGHESLKTTQVYTHIDKQQLRKAVNASPLLKN